MAKDGASKQRAGAKETDREGTLEAKNVARCAALTESALDGPSTAVAATSHDGGAAGGRILSPAVAPIYLHIYAVLR